MNPTQTLGSNSTNNLFQNSFENNAEKENNEPAPILEPMDTVPHTEERSKSIRNDWVEFMSLKTEDIRPLSPEAPINKVEITETKVEFFNQTPRIYEQNETKDKYQPVDVIAEQKGSGSWLEDAGFKLDVKGLLNVFGSLGKSLFGALNIFKEIAIDTAKVFKFQKEKPVEKDPAKAKAAAEKKANQQKNLAAFNEALRTQSGSVASVESIRIETQEKENINKTIKLTNASYKGIKDSFGRLTVYAASMFEREQQEQDKQYKKFEKAQKAASTKGPDLNLDKAAEGGFLSSTGGQGAG